MSPCIHVSSQVLVSQGVFVVRQGPQVPDDGDFGRHGDLHVQRHVPRAADLCRPGRQFNWIKKRAKKEDNVATLLTPKSNFSNP